MNGILLINLGTPETPTQEAIREYLEAFLSDPYVITLPKLIRDFLVQKIILPKRPKISAHAYQQIWTDAGSPLLVHSLNLQNGLQEKLGPSYCVALGMRYSKPSIRDAIETLEKKNCKKIIVLPLFPHFARATTQSSLDVVSATLQEINYQGEIKIIRDFYNQNFYIQTFSKIIQQSLDKNNPEFLLFSYHGLPTRQQGANKYRDHCFATTQLIADQLALPSEKYLTAFQSRLGFTKWIEPYITQSLKSLRKKKIKNISVVCPAFVADCVETLEEINIRLRNQWMTLGGHSFEYISSLNTDENWVTALAEYVRQITNHKNS